MKLVNAKKFYTDNLPQAEITYAGFCKRLKKMYKKDTNYLFKSSQQYLLDPKHETFTNMLKRH